LFAGHDGILAVDIDGANIRVGIIELDDRRAVNLAASKVWASELWRHADEGPGRDDAVDRLIGMLAL
jgi:hypothetical protein